MGDPIAGTFPHLRNTAQAQRRRQSRGRLTDTQDCTTVTPDQKRSNARLGWILLSVVVVFFAGFMVKMALLGG